MSVSQRFFRIVLSGCVLVLLVASATAATIALTAQNNAVQILNNSEQEFSVRYEFSSIESFDVQTVEGMFTEISIPGLSYSTKLGEPKLPVMRKIIAVPLGANVRASVRSFVEENYDLTAQGIAHAIMPAQPSLRKDQTAADVPFIYNRAAYTVSHASVEPVVYAEELGIMRGVRLYTLTVEPVAYDPTAQTLKVYNNIEVDVAFENAEYAATESLRRTTFSPYFESVYQQNILNYRSVNSLDEDLTRYPIRYMIISDPMFEAQLAPFIEWKQQKGFDMVVGYTDEPSIGTTTTSIQSYILNYYNSCAGTPADPKPSFVLFVGDDNLIPAFSGDTGTHITDVDYADLTGDYMPEIYYGRFSARNTGQLQPQIDKTLEYERYEMPDPSYLGEAVMIAGADASYAPTYGNGQINYGTGYYFNSAHGILSHTYLYPASASSDAQIIQDVSNGVGYCNYTAHGSETSWGDPTFTVTDVNNLTNAHKYGTVVGNCCLTNRFQVETCFGEAWLRAANKGSIGYIGGTNNTYWDEDYWWGVGAGAISANPTYAATGPGAYDGMFHDQGQAFPSWYTCQYGFNMSGILAVVEGGSSRINYYWEIYSLMGDPSLSTYFGVPSANSVSCPSQIFVGATSLTLSAAPYSYIGFSMDGDQIASGLVDATGQITLTFASLNSVGTADIVITCQNRIPYFGSIDVIPNSGPYVVLNSHSPTVAAFGQTVNLDVTLLNVGTESAYSVTATLALTDPYVTILDGSATFGTIASEATSTQNDAFSILIPSLVPDEHLLRFTVTVSGSAREEWVSYLDVVLQAPVMSAGTAVINDNTGGNGNGRLDPGETATITVPVMNDGHAASPSASALLSSGSAWVTITDNSEAIGIISAGGSGNAVFEVEIDPATPIGTPANFTCDFEVGDYDVSDNFMRSIGLDLEDFESGGFTNYPWDNDPTTPWIISSSSPYEGLYSAQSGDISDNQVTELSVFAQVATDGNLSFYYKVSSEVGYDSLNFYIDGVKMGEWAGEVGWTRATYPVTVGGHTFLWQYSKDGSLDGGSDCAWIDFIIFPPLGAPRYPDIAVTPELMNHDQLPDVIDTENLTIANLGDGDLSYTIIASTQCSQAPSASFMKLSKYDADPRIPGQNLDNSGGPDGFGHNWIDSDETGGPVYNWVEISSMGTQIGTDDDSTSAPIGIGFPFNFYGTEYTTVNVCSNGWLSFTATSDEYSNQAIPLDASPNNIIAPFWDDMDPTSGGSIYYYADAANNRFIVQWDAIEHYGTTTTGTYTFEVILYDDGRILFQYEELIGTLNSCTVGIEAATGLDGLEIAFNEAYLHDNMAIMINSPCGWISVTPDNGTIASGAPADNLTVEFNSTGMEVGTYIANIWITSNDPDETTVVVPVTLNVTLSAPDPVADLTVIRDGVSVRLEWSTVADAGSYNVWRGDTPEFDSSTGVYLGNTVGTTYTDVLTELRQIAFYYVIAQR